MVMFLAHTSSQRPCGFSGKQPILLPESLSLPAIKSLPGFPLWLQLIISELAIERVKAGLPQHPVRPFNFLQRTPGVDSWGISPYGSSLVFPSRSSATWGCRHRQFTHPALNGYAVKLCPIMLIILISLFGLWGFIAGLVVIAVLLLTNRTVFNNSYLYPLIPFRGRALLSPVCEDEEKDRKITVLVYQKTFVCDKSEEFNGDISPQSVKSWASATCACEAHTNRVFRPCAQRTGKRSRKRGNVSKRARAPF